MTEEPYRWLEAVANRREYVREQLKGGSPVFAASLPDGVLLAGVGSGRSKVFEVYDRQALAGLGHPGDLERIRQSVIDAAHLEAFHRASEDVSLRRLVGQGLSPQLKNGFEQIYSAPFLIELVLAEVGREPGADQLLRLHFDGAFHPQAGGIVVAASAPDPERAAQAWLASAVAGLARPAEVLDLLLQAWWCLEEGRAFDDSLPPEAARRDGWRRAVGAPGRTVEIGWLSRSPTRAARYEEWNLNQAGL